MPTIEQLSSNSQIIAIIIRHEFTKDGIKFFTPGDFSQQLGYLKRKVGDMIQEHILVLHHRVVNFIQKNQLVKKDRVRVNFFNPYKSFFTSHELATGDVILLISGGPGFELLEETEMIKVKQGTYCGNKEQTGFTGEIHWDTTRSNEQSRRCLLTYRSEQDFGYVGAGAFRRRAEADCGMVY